MMIETACPICLSIDGFTCRSEPSGSSDATSFVCDVCGNFSIVGSAVDNHGNLRDPRWTKVRRAALSHHVRLSVSKPAARCLLTSYDLESFVEDRMPVPNPSLQSINVIRYIGDLMTATGEPIASLSPDFSATVGSVDRLFAIDLVHQLIKSGLIFARTVPSTTGLPQVYSVKLTLAGWAKFEEEKAGLLSGMYAFFALKFNDSVLDPLLNELVKPAIRQLGYEAYDMRDVTRAGVIDNLMRIEIRDAAFVVVDLTHANSGAYWEAGFAEGLGKPVIYICEKNKFMRDGTHFDTNHCTTILWDIENPEHFLRDLIATIKRSLKI